MSKKKSARRKSKRNNNNDSASLFGTLKFNVIYFVTGLISFLVVKPFELLNYWKAVLVLKVKMMVSKRDLEDPNLSEKKRARLLNKQSKMMAEYRLVVKKGLEGTGEEEEEVCEKKKSKVEGEEKEKEKLGDEEFKRMKKELAERKRALMHLPRFWVNSTTGTSASVFLTEYAARTPLLLSDIEHLVTYAYGGNALVPPPSRWCSMQKPNRLNNIVVVVVDGVGLSEFVDNEECFSGTMEIFGGKDGNRGIVEFLSPSWYGGSLNSEIHDWGVIGGQRSGEVKNTPVDSESSPENPDPAIAAANFENVINQLGSVFPITGKVKKKKQEIPPGDAFSRTNLMLTLPQLILENYPLPIPSTALSKISFVPTSDSYSPVNPQSKMFSLDCEMCSTASDPQVLTKIAIIDEEMNTVYETLVKPDEEIIDYLTKWSGITKQMMEGVEVKLADVQEKVKEIVSQYPDCVFVGQSLNCDLKALRMTHPYVIDTSVIFNLSGVEGKKSSLRDLALNLIDEEIQVGQQLEDKKKKKVEGHCPVEDATAAMKLVKTKLEKGFTFGNALKNPSFLRQSTKLSLDPMFTSSTFKQNKLDKNVLLVYQSEQNHPAAESTDSSDTATTPASKEDTANDASSPPPQNSNVSPSVSRQITPSNRVTMKAVSTQIFEYFLSVGFYTINPDSASLQKSLQKLDKRISKLYNNLSCNSLFVVVCSKPHERLSGVGVGMNSDIVRRNNGVAFVRCKVSEVMKRKE